MGEHSLYHREIYKSGVEFGRKISERDFKSIEKQNAGLKKEIESLKQELDKAYNEGYDSGRNQWEDDYGFDVPNKLIQSLESAAYKKGLRDKEGINESVKLSEYKKGYQDCEYKHHLEAGERELEIKKEAYFDGYTQALKEMLEQGEDFWDDEDCSENSSEFEGVWESKDNNPHWVLEYDADCGDAVWLKVLSTPSGVVDYHKGQLICLFKEILKQGYVKREEQEAKEGKADINPTCCDGHTILMSENELVEALRGTAKPKGDTRDLQEALMRTQMFLEDEGVQNG